MRVMNILSKSLALPAQSSRWPQLFAYLNRAGRSAMLSFLFWPLFSVIPLDALCDEVPESSISLVVSGADSAQLDSCLEQLALLRKQRKVRVAQVYVLGLAPQKASGGGGGSADPAGPAHAKLRLIGLPAFEFQMAQPLLKPYDITYSPTWIVEYRGRKFVYEGYRNVLELFGRDGTFKEPR